MTPAPVEAVEVHSVKDRQNRQGQFSGIRNLNTGHEWPLQDFVADINR